MDSCQEKDTDYYRLSYIKKKFEDTHNLLYNILCYKYFNGNKEKLENYLEKNKLTS